MSSVQGRVITLGDLFSAFLGSDLARAGRKIPETKIGLHGTTSPEQAKNQAKAAVAQTPVWTCPPAQQAADDLQKTMKSIIAGKDESKSPFGPIFSFVTEEDIRSDLEKEIVEKGIRFVHIRSFDDVGQPKARGGMTVAYRFKTLPSGVPGDVIEVANALCHSNDVFNGKVGREISASNLLMGEVITLRVPKTIAPSSFLKAVFGVQDSLDKVEKVPGHYAVPVSAEIVVRHLPKNQ